MQGSAEGQQQFCSYAAIAIAIVAIGSSVRLIGVGSMSLWADEAVIANIVSVGRISTYASYPASNRPIGYLLVSGWLAGLHNAEWTLRSTSFVPSIAALILFAPICLGLFRSKALALTALASFAFNAWSITYAKDFKPYALEQLVSVGFLGLYLSWRRTGSRLRLAGLGLLAALAPLFSHTAILLSPCYALAVLLAPRSASDRGARRWMLAGVGLSCIVAVVQYVLVGSNTPPELFTTASPSYFRYEGAVAAILWTFERWARMVVDFGPIGLEPPNLATPAGFGTAAVYLGGSALCLRSIVRRRDLQLFLLLVAPLMGTAALALVFPWPFGPERVNLFLIPLVTLMAFLGWDTLSELPLPAGACLRLAVIVTSIGCQQPSDARQFTAKYARFGNAQEELRDALAMIATGEEIAAEAGRRGCVLFSTMSRYALNYHRSFDVTHRDDVRRLLWSRPHEILRDRDADSVEAGVRHALYACPRLWIVLSHYNEIELRAVRDAIEAAGAWSNEEELVGVQLFVVHQRDAS
jgi:hypothetical protein